MRQILVELPARWLFFVLLALALAGFVRGWTLRARPRPARTRAGRAGAPDPATRGARAADQGLLSSPGLLLLGAWLVMGLRGGAWVPSAELFATDWRPIPIYAYGVMLGTSLVVGWFLALRLAREDGIAQEVAARIYMWTAVWAIVGARVLYVLANFRSFDSVLDAFMLHKGGLVAYGGMIGGFLASWYGCWRRKIPLLRWADVSAPSVVLGTGITRIGCFLYGCDYGRRTDLPWGLSFPRGSPAWKDHLDNGWIQAEALGSLPVHPTQLYESLVGFALFGLLMYLRRVRRFRGQVFLGWVLGYGVLRPLIEVLRDDDQRGNVGPLSTSQFIGLASFALGVVLLVVLVRRHRAGLGAPPDQVV